MKKSKKVKAVVPQKEVKAIVPIADNILSSVIINGDLSKLTVDQKVSYYRSYCERLGLDPATKPFDLITLNNKQILYCTRAGAQQLSKLHKVTHDIRDRQTVDGLYMVTCRASLADGRFTDSIGVVYIGQMQADQKANGMMKAETKAKRRATLDLLGLGILDETEVDSIPGARVTPIQPIAEASAEICRVMSEDDLKVTLIAIETSQTLDELKTVYASGYKKAQALNDKESMKKIMVWKDEQKANLVKAGAK